MLYREGVAWIEVQGIELKFLSIISSNGELYICNPRGKKFYKTEHKLTHFLDLGEIEQKQIEWRNDNNG